MRQSTPKTPLLALRGISKSFGAVEALKNISFDIFPGEIIALVGDNGAGKSTLVKILSGVHTQTSGEMQLEGETTTFLSPADALASGIETVYQDLALIEQLDVADNVYLGRERYYGGRWGSSSAYSTASTCVTRQQRPFLNSTSGFPSRPSASDV